MLFRCRRCLYHRQKPDLWFSDDGVCSACLAFDKRAQIDWETRKYQFLELVNAHRGKTHDVIVACSGGKDSTAQIIKCLELGLRPLAITATTDFLTPLGRKNLDNIANLCDLVEVTPHKPTRNKIAKFALEQVGDISWCEHHLIWSVPAQEAMARGIPVVIYGEAQNAEYGAGRKGTEKVERLDKSWIHEYGGLLGLRLSDVGELLDIEDRHLNLYRYPHGDVQALFLGAFFPWDGYENFKIAERNGFTPYHTDVEGSLYNYENVDNFATGPHDRVRWAKFGYSRATDIASNHIRRNRLTREEAIKLVMEREANWPQTYLGKPYSEILGNFDVTIDEFNAVCERFTNHEVVAWASRPGSYQSFCGQSTDASKGVNSILTAA